MNIHMCHSMAMSHPFGYLTYYTHTNLIHINFSTKFMWFLYETMKTKFALNLYEPMKHSKFVMIMKSSKTLFSCSKFMAFDL
jgi:hypothetical protein